MGIVGSTRDFVGRQPGTVASIRHLKVFDIVASLHGLRRASEKVRLSQSAVTYVMARLERQLGVSLLERRACGSYLNDSGVLFHRRIRRMFDQMERALVNLGVPGDRLTIGRITSCMTWLQIGALIAIVEYRTFESAARALAASPRSLQRAARSLERSLGVGLYLQTASGIVATPDAAELALRLKLALREVEWGVEDIEVANGHSGGEIVIGAMPRAGDTLLAAAIHAFITEVAGATVRVVSGNAEDMFAKLACGDVDIVIGQLAEPARNGMTTQLIEQTPYVVAARHGHPLADGRDVTLDDFAGYDWVIGTPGAHRRTRFEELFPEGSRPQARIETCSLPTIRQLLAQSDRLTLLTSMELRSEEEWLVAIPFDSIGSVPGVGLTVREDWLPTHLQSRFLNLFQDKVAGLRTLDGARPGGSASVAHVKGIRKSGDAAWAGR